MNDYKKNYLTFKDHLINKYNFKITYNSCGNSYYFKNLKIISVNKKLSYKNKYYVLIHEFGHYIVDEINKESLYEIKSDKLSKTKFIYSISNEINAWQRGKEYINKNNFFYNEKDFQKFSTQCLMSYVKNGLIKIYDSKININIIKE